MVVRATQQKNGRVHYLSREEGRALFDAQAREQMGMSGDEFIRRWEAGEFDAVIDGPDHNKLMDLALLMPFGR